ncbi:MAG: AI-2E family transporter [Candidatus Xenobia bacterium]
MILSGLAGSVFLLLALAVGVPDAWALGTLAAVGDAIPVLGLLAVVITGTLLALTVSTSRALVLLALYLCYHELELNVLMPRVFGKTLGLTLTAVLISMLVGFELLGPLGTILSLPVGAAVPSVIRWIQEMMEA